MNESVESPSLRVEGALMKSRDSKEVLMVPLMPLVRVCHYPTLSNILAVFE